jgi:glycosyltransferase involved in cell wall biosynthesis
MHFLGQQDYQSTMRILQSSSLMIHPSLEESFGNVLVEAMVLKVPVIAGRNSGAVPWVLGFGSAGILVDVTDKEDIARAALDILQDTHRSKELTDVAFKHAYENFHPNEIALKHLDVYRAVLNGDYPPVASV